MKRPGKILIIGLVVTLIILCVWASVGGEDNIAKEILSFIGAAVFVVGGLAVSALFSNFTQKGGSAYTHKGQDSGLISCKKCGYIGAGHGFCPRCGWNRTEKITSGSNMISCMKCGYLGVGYGSCPRCGWNRIRKISQ